MLARCYPFAVALQKHQKDPPRREGKAKRRINPIWRSFSGETLFERETNRKLLPFSGHQFQETPARVLRWGLVTLHREPRKAIDASNSQGGERERAEFRFDFPFGSNMWFPIQFEASFGWRVSFFRGKIGNAGEKRVFWNWT